VNRFKQTALNLVNRDAHPEVAAILDETSRLEFEQQQLFLAIEPTPKMVQFHPKTAKFQNCPKRHLDIDIDRVLKTLNRAIF
jgi:hypothetical protein